MTQGRRNGHICHACCVRDRLQSRGLSLPSTLTLEREPLAMPSALGWIYQGNFNLLHSICRFRSPSALSHDPSTPCTSLSPFPYHFAAPSLRAQSRTYIACHQLCEKYGDIYHSLANFLRKPIQPSHLSKCSGSSRPLYPFLCERFLYRPRYFPIGRSRTFSFHWYVIREPVAGCK
jgi:hypothetical protein